MMPFKMIITAANTVSRARPAASSPPAAIKETMRATSIKVTASASTRVPKGSPILCATHLGMVDRGEHAAGQRRRDQRHA